MEIYAVRICGYWFLIANIWLHNSVYDYERNIVYHVLWGPTVVVIVIIIFVSVLYDIDYVKAL